MVSVSVERARRGASRLSALRAWRWLWVLLWWSAPAHAAPARGVKTEVRYVHPEAVYLGAGRDDGVKAGQVVEVFRQKRRVGRLRVDGATSHQAVAIPEGDFVARRGDVVRIRDAVAVTPARPATARAGPRAPARFESFVAPSGPFPQVRDHASPAGPLRRRAQAFLVSTGWAYLGGAQPVFDARSRLLLRLDAPLDRQGRVRAVVSAQLVAQLPGVRGGALRPASVFRMEVWEAALAWHPGGGLDVAAGRAMAPGLRYGVMDGVFLGWRFHEALRLQLAVGERADYRTLLPGVEHPILAGAGDGMVRGGWGSVSYHAALSWLGRDVAVLEGAEASARLMVELARLLWLDGDVAAVAWVPSQGMLPGMTLERLGLAASTRQGPLSFRAFGRRQSNAALPSNLSLLPTGYLPGQPFWEVGASTALALGTRWAGAVELEAGGLWDETHARDRVYLVPQVRGRLLPLWSLTARVGYRAEFGSTAAQLASFTVDAEPVTGARLMLMQQAGVIMVQESGAMADLLVDRGTRRLLWTYGWSASADYRMLGVVVAGVRTRGLYGAAGKGLEVSVFVGTDRIP